MKRKRSLGGKIFVAMIALVLGMLLAAGIIFAITARNVSSTLASSNRSLSETIGEQSLVYMDEQSQVRLAEIADDNAEIADGAFSEFERGVRVVAAVAERIYEHPELYSDRTVPLPDAKNDGKLTMQVLYSAATDPEDPEIREELGLIGNVQDVLLAVNASQDSMASCYVATESGFMVQADYISAKKFDEDGNLLPLEAKERPWYRGAAETGEAYFTPVTKDAHTPRLGIMCGVPVYAGGKLMGVAGAGMYLDDLENLVRSVNPGHSGNVCILNENAQVLFSTFEEGSLAAVADAEDLRGSENSMLAGLAQKAVGGGSGVAQLTVDDVPVYAAYAPMKTVGWSMLVILPREEVEAPTDRLLEKVDVMTEQAYQDSSAYIRSAAYFLLGLLAAAVAVALVMSVLLSRRIVKPIRQLAGEVGRMEGSNLDFKWDLRTGDETEMLANSFQSLTLRMKEYIGELAAVTAENERINTELTLAAGIQSDMLPGVFPPFPERKDLDIFASMDAAKEVGGDFYDFFFVDEDHLCLVIADVSGKGVPAALFMMATKIIIGNYAMLGQSPAEILENANNAVYATNREGMFVTVWIGILDMRTGILTAANAGHEYPVILRPGGAFELLKDKHGFVLGGMSDMRYREYTVEMKPGAKLFLYTDGVPEATDTQNALFGNERMLEALNADTGADPETLLGNVRRAVDGFVGGAEQFDDLTMLCVEFKGSPEGTDGEEKKL